MNLSSKSVQLLFLVATFASKNVQIGSFTFLSGYPNTRLCKIYDHNPTYVISIREILTLMMVIHNKAYIILKSRKILNEASNNQWFFFSFRNGIVSYSDRFMLSVKRKKIPIKSTTHSNNIFRDIIFLLSCWKPIGSKWFLSIIVLKKERVRLWMVSNIKTIKKKKYRSLFQQHMKIQA